MRPPQTDPPRPGPHAGPRSYRTGDWYAVLGPRAVLLLPPEERARAARLWELADGGADVEDLLDALLAGGLRALAGFALAGVVEGGDTRLLLRGAARAEVHAADGVTTLDGTEAASFVDRRFAGVQRLTLAAGEATGPDLVVLDGLVRAARVDHPPYVPARPAAPAPPAVEPEEAAPPAPAPPPPPPAPRTPPPPPPAMPPPPPVSPDAPTAFDLPAVPDVPVPPPPPLGGASPVPSTPPPGSPIGWSVASDLAPGRHAHPSPPAEPEPEPEPEPEVVAPEPDAPVARLHISDGTVVDVDRPVLIGRAPEAGRAGAGPDARLVTVPSPHQEISATHLEVRPGTGADLGTAVVTDLGSTNGSVLARPELPAEALQPGVAALLVPGSLIDLGDGVTIRVTAP